MSDFKKPLTPAERARMEAFTRAFIRMQEIEFEREYRRALPAIRASIHRLAVDAHLHGLRELTLAYGWSLSKIDVMLKERGRDGG
jgi:hypothetical protein